MNKGTNPVPAPPVLTSWKDIARYMGKGVRTVQRWEQDFGLPVRRALGSGKKAILARPADLDAWIALRCSSRSANFAPNGLALSPLDPHAAPASLPALSDFHAQIESVRLLCSSNRALTVELCSTLDQLRAELRLMKENRSAGLLSRPDPARQAV